MVVEVILLCECTYVRLWGYWRVSDAENADVLSRSLSLPIVEFADPGEKLPHSVTLEKKEDVVKLAGRLGWMGKKMPAIDFILVVPVSSCLKIQKFRRRPSTRARDGCEKVSPEKMCTLRVFFAHSRPVPALAVFPLLCPRGQSPANNGGKRAGHVERVGRPPP